MPTYTSYTNYVKSKGNSAVCCPTTNPCIGGVTSVIRETADLTELRANFDASINDLYSRLLDATGLNPSEDTVTYVTNSDFPNNDLSLALDSSNLIFNFNNRATTITFQDISRTAPTRFLITAQTDKRQNGIYEISSVRITDTSFLLVRANDMSNGSTAINTYVFVTSLNQGWLQSSGTTTVGTQPLSFSLFSKLDISLTTVLSGTNITVIPSSSNQEFTVSLNSDISISSIDISKSLTLNDASLIFQTQDSSKVTIVGPTGLTNDYTLKLPNQYSEGTDFSGRALKVDGSGQLYFSNILDLSLGENSNLDLSFTGTKYLLSLFQDISITSIDISDSIILKSQRNNSKVTIKGPLNADISYTLSLPDSIPNSSSLSGGFLQSTASGNLYFSNSWLNDITGDNNIFVDISRDAPHTRIKLKNSIDISSIILDTSLVFQTQDSSKVTIIGPSGLTHDYTLKLPNQYREGTDFSGQFLKVDGSGQLYFADASLDIIEINTGIGNTNLTISSEKTDDINTFTIDLCSNLDLSSITLHNKLELKDAATIEFYNTTNSKKVLIGISTELTNDYNLYLPSSDPSSAITSQRNIPELDSKAFITVDNDGNMKFESLQVLLDSARAGIHAREAVRYITINDPSNVLHQSSDPSFLTFISGDHRIGNISSISDFSYGDRILINNQDFYNPDLAVWNGIYTISGDFGEAISGVSFELHRSHDFDSSGEANNAFVFVTDGSNTNTGWIVQQTSSAELIIGTDPIKFVQFTGEQNLNINVGSNNNIIKHTSPSSVNDITLSLSSNITEISSIQFDTAGEIKFLTNNDNTLSLKAPTSTDSNYSLILPQKAEISGSYMRVDGSGQLYFEDISLHDISLVSTSKHNNLTIDASLINPTTKKFTIDLCDNLILENLTISGGNLHINNDASLVFVVSDTSNIVIKAPTDISQSYSLTLPDTIGISGTGHKYLQTDQSGNLRFVDIGPDLSLANLSISNELFIGQDASLVFDTSSGNNIVINAPIDISNSYSLTLPNAIGISGTGHKYLQTDQSGNLSFVDISNIQADISLISHTPFITINPSNIGDGDLSGFIFDIGPDLSLANLSISNELFIGQDASLVFDTSGGNKISINAPTDISNSYSLTLPTNLGAGPNDVIVSDSSGQLTVKSLAEISFNILALTALNNVKETFTTNLLEDWQNTNLSIITNVVMETAINNGVPIRYYLPLNTFSSNRESIADASIQYLNYDQQETEIATSALNYINNRSLSAPVHLNVTNVLNFSSIQNIILNYINTSNSINLKVLTNIMSNDFYLRVLNLSTIFSRNPNNFNNNNLSINNKKIQNFITSINNSVQDNPGGNRYKRTDFNETSCILPTNLNPPYYFQKIDSGTDRHISIDYSNDTSYNIVSDTGANKNDTFNQLLIFGDVEYEQNFFILKNLLDCSSINSNVQSSKNIVFYFYCQNTNNRDNEFDSNFSFDISNTWNDFSDVALADISLGPFDLSFSLDGNDYNSIDFSFQVLDENFVPRSNINNGGEPFYIHQHESSAILNKNNINFNIKLSDKNYLVQFPQWKYDIAGVGATSIPINGINLNINKGLTPGNNKFTIHFNNISDNSKNIFTNPNDRTTIADYIRTDASDILYYDYGNIMFALDGSINSYLKLTDISYDKILIPPLFQLNRFNSHITQNHQYLNYDTSTILQDTTGYDISAINFSDTIHNAQSTDFARTDISFISQIHINSNFQFIECLSSNLNTINFGNLETEITNNDSSNILILCPLIEQSYILESDDDGSPTFSSVKFQQDITFNNSLSRYYPIFSYFNTLRKTGNASYNVSVVISTNESDTLNNIIFSESAGSYLHSDDNSFDYSNNLFVNNRTANTTKIFSTHYDIPNKFLKDSSFSITNLNYVAPKNIQTYITQPNLIDRLLVYEINTLPDTVRQLITLLQDTNNIFKNYSIIDTLMNFYGMYIFYIFDGVHSTQSGITASKQYSIVGQVLLKFLTNYRKIRQCIIDNNLLSSLYPISNRERNGVRILNAITISNDMFSNVQPFYLNNQGLDTIFEDLNFSFFNLDLATDFNRDINSFGVVTLSENNFFTFRLTLLLIHFINNRRYTNNFIKFNRYTNSTILSYTYEKLGDQPKLTDISNNYHGLIDLSGNERYDILDRWYHTYPDPFQFLTVNDN